MENPLKRKRPSLSPDIKDDKSDVDIHEARARNDMRLKSIFEGIFEKYGRDFTDIGDEIDLRTGDLLVNNGHIGALDGEGDAGAIGDWVLDRDSPFSSNDQAEDTAEESYQARLHAHNTDDVISEENGTPSGRKARSILSQLLPHPEESRGIMDEGVSTTSEAEDDDRSSVDSLLDTALCVHDTRTSREIGTGEAVTEKANPPAEGSNQSQAQRTERLDETVDPIWRVPEISAKFTTPTVLSRSKPKTPLKPVRSQSPPGAGSVWALPRTSRRNTDGGKRRKPKESPKKRKKHQSSPVVCDWSFADAPDGSESDDPLQEDYEPSPTPKGTLYIREKRRGPSTASHTKNTCSSCKQVFSHDGYVSHLKTVLSDPAETGHDLIDLKKQLDTITGGRAHESIYNTTVTLEPVPSTDIPTSDPEEREHHESTPTGTKRAARTVFSPEEAKQIIELRLVRGVTWKEILQHFPQKKMLQLNNWYTYHWCYRKANPPLSSKPWSKAENNKLEGLKHQPGLTWHGIRADLPGRSHPEVEFKLLQLWAGDGVDST
ncbi:hypothetical protein BJX99DRAFT_94922 [Aspergillus californicus]